MPSGNPAYLWLSEHDRGMTVVYALCSDKSESSEKTRIYLLRCSAFF